MENNIWTLSSRAPRKKFLMPPPCNLKLSEVLLDSVAEAGLDKAEAKKATAPWTFSCCYTA